MKMHNGLPRAPKRSRYGATRLLLFRHPRPTVPRVRLLPVFLPHHGCMGRCAFCTQEAQTGAPKIALAQAYDRLARELSQRKTDGAPPTEVGFYGGTFTALPGDWSTRFVELAASFKEAQAVTSVRCSTRPDAVDPGLLAQLRRAGLDAVELGVQSFNEEALAVMDRGYSGDAAQTGCAAVREAGLDLGLHLMAGLPLAGGSAPTRIFDADVAAALATGAETVRLHPLLVLAGTRLATDYAGGRLRLWSLPRTVWALGEAMLRFWRAGVRVIRVGLAAEDSLERAVLAGPRHPSLGQMAAGRALLSHVAPLTALLPPGELALIHPPRYESDIRGWRGELEPAWERLGLGASGRSSWKRDFFLLTSRKSSMDVPDAVRPLPGEAPASPKERT